jgi:multidrug efflux pump
LISGFVALTLTPMLCSRTLRPHAGHGGESDGEGAGNGPGGDGAPGLAAGVVAAPPARVGDRVSSSGSPAGSVEANWFDRAFARLSRFYHRLVLAALRHRRTVMIATLLIIVAIAALFRFIPRELVPTEDRGWIFTFIQAPEGATLDYTDHYVQMAEGIYDAMPAKDRMFSAIGLFGGVTDGFMFVGLKPHGQRPPSQVLVQQLFPRMLGLPGVIAFAFNPPSLGGGFGGAVQFVLQADSYDQLAQATRTMMQEAGKLGYLVNMNTDLKLNKPQLEIDIDRPRAAELGVSVADIGGTLETLLGGSRVTRFKRGNHQYEVMLQVPRPDRSDPSVIDGLYVRGTKGLVQMASVTQMHEQAAPRALNHFNRVRSATLSASLAPGVTIGKAVGDLKAIASRALPAGVRTDLAGESREYVESSGGLNFLFIIALVFIYLVLAGQFESFIHPLTILLSVPLAVFGALVTLFAFHMTINIYSQVGLIMLIGLVTKNAILIVEYANQRRRGAGGQPPLPLVEAVVGAARIRLRPILMTTLATVFGVMPIALGLGAGAESRKPLGAAVVGGMVFSTLLTLVIVPVVYTLLARFAGEPLRAEAEVQPRQVRPAALPETVETA